MVKRGARAFLAAASLGVAVPETAYACNGLIPETGPPPWPRALDAMDLVRLRDIGPPDIVPGTGHLLAVSPDGNRVAFQLRQADPARNAYCLGMVVLEVGENARPRLIDRGGEMVRVRFDFRGKAAFPTGTPRLIAPHWFPDGSSIAYLRQDGGIVRVWRAPADGSGAAPITPPGIDIEDFRISADGERLVYAVRTGLRAANQAIAREGLSGFHYDDRYAPVASRRPFPPEGDVAESFVLDLSDGAVRPARPDEAAMLRQTSTITTDGLRVGMTPSGPRGALVLGAGRPGETEIMCPDPACSALELAPFALPGGEIGFLRREGWAREDTAFYAWRPGQPRARRLHATTDRFSDCVASARGLLCLRESSNVPRRLELIEPADGRRRIVFDPNPDFGRLALGEVRRLHWTNDLGLEVIGDLVYPVGYRPGRHYPMIVVQYDTRGFLRGGTGDDYPIQLFANHGYAVLSISRPPGMGQLAGATDAIASGRLNLAGLADRRSTLSAVETGVRRVIDAGIADPDRIGLTGMSDGSSTAAFALLHSRLFAAMAMSHCCTDTSLPARVGPAAARYFAAIGYPPLSGDGEAFWRDFSISRNARRIDVPVLLQLSDDEYMTALESYTALRETGAPVDMFVFPDEHHVKFQPAHRLAIYRRSLAWFDYWLRDLRDPAPERVPELAHWDALREEARRRPQVPQPASTPDQ